MNVTIDPDAGFCFGVDRAIATAETELAKKGKLYCLDEIVHNTSELERLKAEGLTIISHAELPGLSGERVMIRAHGEPPGTFALAGELGIELIDATCPIVIKLQQKIRKSYEEDFPKGAQIVIFGKKGHAEVVGLSGQTGGNAIIISGAADLNLPDLSKPVRLFAQTTMDHDAYESIAGQLRAKMKLLKNDDLIVNNSFCRQVSGRSANLKEFASSNDLVLFVSDRKSSNGAFLFNVCRSVNKNSYFIHERSELIPAWFSETESVGITGATSTPVWLMNDIAEAVEEM